jgi:GntR family transcriptional regulator, transcriptional repressor for pyruvate dehydrogenase complex
MKLAPIPKKSLSDHVFEQLTGEIVSGALRPGESLPSERALTEALGVNRGAIREAVKRLSQAGLVASRHGSGHKVLNYRFSAGLDLLPRLLFSGGDIDPSVVRSVMELRSAIAPDAARLCAERSPADGAALHALVAQMTPERSVAELQELAVQFWEVVVNGSQNIAYRLAYNSLRLIYDEVRDALAEVLADELRDTQGYKAIADAVGHGSGFTAHCEGAALTERGLNGINSAFATLATLGS